MTLELCSQRSKNSSSSSQVGGFRTLEATENIFTARNCNLSLRRA
jgi:hypothetical protein